MTSIQQGYARILVATDFSPHADAALRQAVWVARQCGAAVVLVHVLRDVRRAMTATPYQARLDLLYGDGDLFQRELGNTAEKALGTCDCSVLTVKPDGFVSPIDPAVWPLRPD